MAMRSELDPLRTSALPNSFDRTSDWLRAAPPRRPRRLPAAVLLTLLLVAAAWSWPVEVTEQTATVVEALSSERVEAGHPTLQLIDRIVGDERAHLVELEALGEKWMGGTVVRYAFAGDSPVRVSVWRDSLASVEGVRRVRIVPVETRGRSRLGVEAARRMLGVRVTSRTTDRELQAELDRLFARSPLAASPSAPVGDTLRIVRLGERLTIRIPDGATVYPVPVGKGGPKALFVTPLDSGALQQRRIWISPHGARQPLGIRLDSLSPQAARVLRDQLDEIMRRRDEAGDSLPRVLRIRASNTHPDSSRVPLSPLP